MHFVRLSGELITAAIWMRRVVWCFVPHRELGRHVQGDIDLVRRSRHDLWQPALVRVAQGQAVGLTPIAKHHWSLKRKFRTNRITFFRLFDKNTYITEFDISWVCFRFRFPSPRITVHFCFSRSKSNVQIRAIRVGALGTKFTVSFWNGGRFRIIRDDIVWSRVVVIGQGLLRCRLLATLQRVELVLQLVLLVVAKLHDNHNTDND